LSDQALIEEVQSAAGREAGGTARMISLLAELDARRFVSRSRVFFPLYVLHSGAALAEHAAYGRIVAARAACRFPVVLDLLADGAETLTTVAMPGAQRP
jgi:hypothetical protein